MNVGYTRTEKDIVDNTPIPLFQGGRTKKLIQVPLLPIARVDAWLSEADKAMQLGAQVDALSGRVTGMEEERVKLVKKLTPARIDLSEGPGTPPPKGESYQEVKAQLESIMAYLESASRACRERTREYLDGLLDCLASYDPERLDRQALIDGGITDEQIIAAFLRLRNLNDPLARTQSISAEMLKAQIDALK
jgi:hypothetical protein